MPALLISAQSWSSASTQNRATVGVLVLRPHCFRELNRRDGLENGVERSAKDAGLLTDRTATVDASPSDEAAARASAGAFRRSSCRTRMSAIADRFRGAPWPRAIALRHAAGSCGFPENNCDTDAKSFRYAVTSGRIQGADGDRSRRARECPIYYIRRL